MTTENLWKQKLAAWVHDPAEKALVLMRDRAGHEGGTVAALRKTLGLADTPLDKRADWMASAADRPQWPWKPDQKGAHWATVRFVDEPQLKHPLSGESIDLKRLDEITVEPLKSASIDHFDQLIDHTTDGAIDHRSTFLAFWRFGPDTPAPGLNHLWQLLPADTRVPDHSIWQHLDIVSALACAMVEGDEPALLNVSFGPVQDFIAQARSTSDLWAGSHLLASIVWEGMRPLCEALGPDAILFPNLRGIAAVDRWLLDNAPEHLRKDWEERFRQSDSLWLERSSDANPLYAATLPNKFLAVVPARMADELALQIERAAKRTAQEWARDAAEQVFEQAGRTAGKHYLEQLEQQLDGFPEVFWSVTRWPVTAKGKNGLPEDFRILHKALQAFGTDGLFKEKAWTIFERNDEGLAEFYQPNAGALYPAVHELAERGLAAAKTLRPFLQSPQQGFRCTVCGEREWLTDTLEYDKSGEEAAENLLFLPPGQRQNITVTGQTGTVWQALSENKKSWAKPGEHLCGICTLKRLWPTLFADQIGDHIDGRPQRFVVSTHTLALAPTLARVAGKIAQHDLLKLQTLTNLAEGEDAALPASLHKQIRNLEDKQAASVLRKLPVALDRLKEKTATEREQQQLEGIERTLQEVLGEKPEAYYALLLMDGDNMGAWLSGKEERFQQGMDEAWHETIRIKVKDRFANQAEIADYLAAPRPASPARHAFISRALNNFSTHVVRHVVEEVCKGKLIYAGGDDVLAMLSVDDLLPAMMLLRAAYSGAGDAEGLNLPDLKKLRFQKGFVQLRKQLMPMMGHKATASVGAVVVHHSAPLSAVMRQLRQAEKDAKNHGRNAFCLRLLKRGGGEVGIKAPLWDPQDPQPRLRDSLPGYLWRLAEAIAQTDDFSRGAIYQAQEWLASVPPPPDDDRVWRDMLAKNLRFRFERQGGPAELAEEACNWIGERIAPAAPPSKARAPHQAADALANLFATAEFLARNSRIGKGAQS